MASCHPTSAYHQNESDFELSIFCATYCSDVGEEVLGETLHLVNVLNFFVILTGKNFFEIAHHPQFFVELAFTSGNQARVLPVDKKEDSHSN